MSLVLTNPTLPVIYDSVDIDDNFADVTNKFGNIDNSDIKAAAGIALSKLAASYQEVWLQLIYINGAQGAWPALGATTPLAICSLPGSDADTAWVATDVSWVCTDTGTTAGSFDVRYGAYNAGGAWANAGTIIAGVSMPVVGAGNLGNQGRALENGSVTITQAAGVRAIALMSAGAGVAVLDAGVTAQLTVSVCLKRQIF